MRRSAFNQIILALLTTFLTVGLIAYYVSMYRHVRQPPEAPMAQPDPEAYFKPPFENAPIVARYDLGKPRLSLADLVPDDSRCVYCFCCGSVYGQPRYLLPFGYNILLVAISAYLEMGTWLDRR